MGSKFEGDDLRKVDPKFSEPRFSQYLEAVERLESLAGKAYGKSVLAFAVRWVLEKGLPITIWGGCIKAPVGAEFMAPPTGLQ